MKPARLTRPDIQLRLDRRGIIRDVTLTPGLPEEALALWPGQDWAMTVDPASAEALRQMLAQLHDGELAAYLHVIQRFPDGSEVAVEYAACQPGGEGGILVVGRTRPAEPAAESPTAEPLFDQMPDGFVVLDAEGRVLRANRAFLDMAQRGTEAAILGESLACWLNAPGGDLAVLLATLGQHGAIRLLGVRLTGALGCERDVEISGTLHQGGAATVIGLVIRDIGRRLPPQGATDVQGNAIAELTSEVGRTPLLSIVRAAGALVERACIDEALRQSGGNRTAAAEMLGLSRQSLYAKLDRYRLDARAELTALPGPLPADPEGPRGEAAGGTEPAAPRELADAATRRPAHARA